MGWSPTRTKTGLVCEDPKVATDALTAAGINTHFYVSPDTADKGQSWRRSLREFVPRLFKDGC